MRIATLNAQNLRLRQGEAGAALDGARDRDDPLDTGPGARALDRIDRDLTAEVLARADADVIALQEVFDAATLDHFHDTCLAPAGLSPYPHRICLPGNDGRGLDLALLSRLPCATVDSHAHLTPEDLDIPPASPADAGRPLFRRDCLIARIGRITLFVCHLKAPYPDADAAWPVRRMEALAVRRLVEARFADRSEGYWLILGDLNEPRLPPAGHRPAIAPLLEDFAVDLLTRLPEGQRWSFFEPHARRYSRPDALLASPALARDWAAAMPRVLRLGLGHEAARYPGPRLPGVGAHRPHASDHAALVVDFPGL